MRLVGAERSGSSPPASLFGDATMIGVAASVLGSQASKRLSHAARQCRRRQLAWNVSAWASRCWRACIIIMASASRWDSEGARRDEVAARVRAGRVEVCRCGMES